VDYGIGYSQKGTEMNLNLRHPRTRNEKHQNSDTPVRVKRRPRNLPDDWDDKRRSREFSRSWKNTKRKWQHLKEKS
jgi:hypothetical protein